MSPARDIHYVNYLKGLAILGVIGLHILSSFHGAYDTSNGLRYWVYGLDQVLRFCVPLFVALSGYSLARRYAAQINLAQFFWKRVVRLVPLFLLWSGVFIWINQSMPSLQQILLGKADYHLYFVPMIIQLYCLFPLLRVALQRWPHLTLGVLLITQAAMLMYLSPLGVALGVNPASLIDQNHYALSLCWIGYFGLGMWIATRPKLKIRQGHLVFWGSCLFLGLALALVSAFWQIHAGGDLIGSLRFTRLPVMLYGIGVIGLSLSWRLRVINWIASFGKQSYLIYLSHTLVLRLIFACVYGPVVWVAFVPLAIVGAIALLVSSRAP